MCTSFMLMMYTSYSIDTILKRRRDGKGEREREREGEGEGEGEVEGEGGRENKREREGEGGERERGRGREGERERIGRDHFYKGAVVHFLLKWIMFVMGTWLPWLLLLHNISRQGATP